MDDATTSVVVVAASVTIERVQTGDAATTTMTLPSLDAFGAPGDAVPARLAEVAMPLRPIRRSRQETAWAASPPTLRRCRQATPTRRRRRPRGRHPWRFRLPAVREDCRAHVHHSIDVAPTLLCVVVPAGQAVQGFGAETAYVQQSFIFSVGRQVLHSPGMQFVSSL